MCLKKSSRNFHGHDLGPCCCHVDWGFCPNRSGFGICLSHYRNSKSWLTELSHHVSFRMFSGRMFSALGFTLVCLRLKTWPLELFFAFSVLLRGSDDFQILGHLFLPSWWKKTCKAFTFAPNLFKASFEWLLRCWFMRVSRSPAWVSLVILVVWLINHLLLLVVPIYRHSEEILLLYSWSTLFMLF